jgi:MerR family copper efflux transcriptional regulator
MEDTFTVGEAARRVGTTAKTLRYYEAMGLLPPARRGRNGYRHYDSGDLNRLAFIRRAKALGLTLDEIRELVTVAEDGRCELTKAELSQILARKIDDCTRRIDALVAFRSTLEAAARQITVSDERQAEPCCPNCATFDPSCHCLPIPLDLPLTGKV